MAANEKVPRSKHVSRLSEASQFFMAEDAETLNAVEDWPTVDSDSTSERVIELLNQAQLSDREAKISFLKQVQELIVNKDPTLLDNFLDELLVFQQDRSPDVRRFVVGFIEEACKKDAELLPKTVEPLAYMLNDEIVAVQKRVILGVTQLYKYALQFVCKQKSVNEDVEHMWEIVLHMKEHILNLLESDNDGIRTHAIKFMEMIILCQSLKGQEAEGAKKIEGDFSLDMVPRSHPFIKMTDLREEGGTTLEALLTFIASPTISGVNLMAALGSLTSIAQKRPTLMSTVVQAFESLHANLPTTLSKSQVSSVRKNLKLHLFGLMKHQSSVEFLPQISTLLTDLGATQAELQKNLPKINLDQKRPRPSAESDSGAPAKKQKTEEAPSAPEVMSSQAAIEMTSEDILPRLSKDNVVELIIMSMLALPDNMPSHFQETYTPIAAAGGRTQKAHLARLLGAQMFNAGIGAGAEKMQELKRMQQDPRLKRKEEAPQSISVILGTGSGTGAGGSGPSIISSMDMDEQDISMRGSAQAMMDDRSDSKDKDKPAIKKAPIVPKPHQGPQLRMRKIKPFKLSDVTRILTPDVRNNMMVQAMKRILAAERSAVQGGVIQERLNIIVGLVSQFGGELQKVLQDFIVEDPRARYELAVEWLYKQYTAAEESQEKQDSYNRALTGFLEALKERLDAKDKLFTKFLLEAPIVTDGALEIVQTYCEDSDRLQVGFGTLRELAMKRPAGQEDFVQILLKLSTHEKEQVRVQAIHSAKKLHSKSELSGIIEQYALASLKQLLLDHPPHPTSADSEDKPPGEDTAYEWTDESIKLCLYLYLALLPLNHKLFHELAVVYTDALPMIKRTILRHLESPVRAVGMTSPELLKLVETCPAGAETLITRILHIITDKASPSPELVKRVKELYHKRVSDVRFLIPVLTGLEKQEVIEVLPKLIKQSPNVVKEVFNRLLGCFHGDSTFSARSPLSPSELLVALHNIENKSDMKSVMKAISLCFAEKTIYTQEVLAVVLQQLMEYNPLPTLFMRTVIQSLSICPRLVGFVMNILSKLITKQVWKQPKVWQGFVKCCQMTKPQSFSVLLQLPPRELESAFEISPDLCDMLVTHVQSFTPHQKAHIPRSLLQILERDPKKDEHKKGKTEKLDDLDEDGEGMSSPHRESKGHRRHKSERKEKKRSRREKARSPKSRRSKRGDKESEDESSKSEDEPMDT